MPLQRAASAAAAAACGRSIGSFAAFHNGGIIGCSPVGRMLQQQHRVFSSTVRGRFGRESSRGRLKAIFSSIAGAAVGMFAGWKAHAMSAAADEGFTGAAAVVRLCPAAAYTPDKSSSRETPDGRVQIFKPPQVQGKHENAYVPSVCLPLLDLLVPFLLLLHVVGTYILCALLCWCGCCRSLARIRRIAGRLYIIANPRAASSRPEDCCRCCSGSPRCSAARRPTGNYPSNREVSSCPSHRYCRCISRCTEGRSSHCLGC